MQINNVIDSSRLWVVLKGAESSARAGDRGTAACKAETSNRSHAAPIPDIRQQNKQPDVGGF